MSDNPLLSRHEKAHIRHDALTPNRQCAYAAANPPTGLVRGVRMTVQITAKVVQTSRTYTSLNVPAATIEEAHEVVADHVRAGWRDVCAEVIDADGEVVAYFECGRWVK